MEWTVNGPTGEKKISTDKARQGKRGQPVLIVLIAALVLVAIAWAISEFYGQSIEDDAVVSPPGVEGEANGG
jgi:flagellar basal body-associated protein FliL